MVVDDSLGAVTETHVSYVFFTADRAFKLKKAIRTPFLDYSTLAARRWACEREVALNRRLCPDVYHGAVALVGDDGQIMDHMVVMRRLPASRRLATLVKQNAPDVRAQLDGLAGLLAGFHRGAARSAEIDAPARAQARAVRWAANSTELSRLVDTPTDLAAVATVDGLAARYLAGREALFEGRIAAGRAVDGHGDFLAEDIFCLDDGPRVLDCLEFDDQLRYGDGLADVGFLAMDLERLDRPDLADAFLDGYRRASGDSWPASLADHYVAYAAQVRAKVARLRGDPDEARRLLALAVKHLEHATVRLVLVGGAPGTGKSTLAAGLGRELGWVVLRSDVVRKELAGVAPHLRAAASLGQGIYRPEVTEATYHELVERARSLLTRGESVILDCTWPTDDLRRSARQLAADTAAVIVELRCDAPADTAAARVAHRAAQEADASDADQTVAAALRAVAQPWPEARVVDTSSRPTEALVKAVRDIEAVAGTAAAQAVARSDDTMAANLRVRQH